VRINTFSRGVRWVFTFGICLLLSEGFKLLQNLPMRILLVSSGRFFWGLPFYLKSSREGSIPRSVGKSIPSQSMPGKGTMRKALQEYIHLEIGH